MIARGVAPALLVCALFAQAEAVSHDPRAPLPLEQRYMDLDKLTPVQVGERLVRDLHCSACHELPAAATGPLKREDGWPIAPVLTTEGDKVQAGWLSPFLEAPFLLRPASLARMPTFYLADDERAGLTAYLRSLRDPDPVDLTTFDFDMHGPDTEEALFMGEMQVKMLQCRQCHLIDGAMAGSEQLPQAPDLAFAAGRLQRAWAYRWLLDPQRLEPGTMMPGFFYADGEELTEDPEAEIDGIVHYLFSLGESEPAAAPPAPDAEAVARGAALFARNNCGGCHIVGEAPPPDRAGPPLLFEGSRVQVGWLRQYFRTPHQLRPQGYLPGKLARMPYFRLSEAELRPIAEYLMTLRREPATPSGITWESVSVDAPQAAALFEQRGCGKCHAQNSTATWAGPPAGTMARLQREFVYQYCIDPTPFGQPPGFTHPTVAATEAQVMAAFLARPLPSARTPGGTS